MAAPKGRQQSEELGLQVQQSLYSEGGTWYQNPKDFPCAFHDGEGYVIVESREHWESLQVKPADGGTFFAVGKKTNVRGGSIKGLSEYVRHDAPTKGTPTPPEPEFPLPAVREVPAVREDPWSTEKIARLAADLLWEPEQLQEILDDLTEKGQVIFYGPPGTGKTYVARALARHCRLHGGDFDIVQFHPSYSYEDFVEGYRPRLIKGHPGFELVSGPLMRIAEKARGNQDAFFILVIDELNRGNVAKVFGELYFLLEYRDEEVRLQYGGDRPGFSLPPNLWFICTMNTADRSIALMDAALRRRFFFAPFFPDEPPIRGLLRRWLEREGQDTLAADLIDTANKRLDRDMGIGPSYFMSGETLDESRVRRIWRRSVLPYIEEQFFGDADKLSEFTLDRLKLSLKGPVPAAGEETGDKSNESGDSTRNDNVIIDPS